MSFAMQNPVDFLFWSCIETWSGKGAFKSRKSGPFFILLNERSLGTKVFYYYRIIKQEMVETETSEQSIILNPPSNLKFRT